MAIQVRCDVGGEVEDAPGTVTTFPSSMLLGTRARTTLPSGWQYVEVPMPQGDKRLRTVCPACMMRVWRLFGIVGESTTGCVRCTHAPVLHRGPNGCTHKDGCGCELSEAESTDEGWANPPEPGS